MPHTLSWARPTRTGSTYVVYAADSPFNVADFKKSKTCLYDIQLCHTVNFIVGAPYDPIGKLTLLDRLLRHKSGGN